MIKHIIFDFGGVLLNLDFKKSFAAFTNLGYENFAELYSQNKAIDLFQKLETGKISPDAFYKAMQKLASKPVTEEQIKQAWNAMLLSYRTESLQFLTSLQKKYNLYLLSNTNAIHYDYFSKLLVETTSYKRVEDFFTKAWYSHIVQLRKPDIEIYEYIINDGGLKPSETLFIDDTKINLANAESVGLKTHLLLPTERIEILDYTMY